MKKHYVLFIFFVLATFLLLNRCSDSSTNPTPTDQTTVKTTISGTVLDENNSPIAGAEVSCAGQTATTNAQGGFSFSNISVPKSRFVVNSVMSGYFNGSFADAPKANGISNIKIFMMNSGVTETVNSANGGVVELSNGTAVELTSNSISKEDGSAYSGNVNVSVAYLDPTSENFSNLIPGGDLMAQGSNNTQSTLYSYGIIKVDMKGDSGEKLQIKSGNTSQITVDIPSSMEGDAPATIPLWHYDETTGLWKEEGTATKQGDKYIGTVSHFSDWNCDVPEGTGTVKGLVVDCNNLPVSGIVVKIGQASAVTDADGKFERRVPANTAFEVQVLGNRNFGLVSTPVPVSPLTEGTTYDVGTLHVDCPAYVKGLIKCGTDVKYGQVVISWDGGYNSQYTGTDGSFKLPTDIAKNATISIYTFDGKYKSFNITTPAIRGETLDLGTIEVCDQVVLGENKFTLNGDGFNNRTFTFSGDTNFVYGYFDPQDTLTWIWMYQVFQTDTIQFWTTFKGTTVGTATDVFFYLYHNSKYYYGFPGMPNTSASLSITAYNGIGGLIEGSFNGVVSELFGSSSITITNGKFSVVRTVAQTPGDKKQVIKFKKLLKQIR